MKKTLLATSCALLLSTSLSGALMAESAVESGLLRIATFNVSMEALNYLPYDKHRKTLAVGNELKNALKSDHQQIKNIAEIIQRTNPDVILLNEFDREDDTNKNIELFLTKYLSVSQNGYDPIKFPYYYHGPVNTGVTINADLNNNGVNSELPSDTHGFGHFPGHFGMILLSKYPIDEKKIRTFQKFKWQDMPGALVPIIPETNKPYYNEQAWQSLRLSSKSHWDIPVKIGNQNIHILASHPTPPVFDGPEDRNGKRNHDEIRFWLDYISPNKASYIYDDNNNKGGLAKNSTFVILGDQNASAVEGDAINNSISSLLSSEKIQDPMPTSIGGKNHSADNNYSPYHTAYWRMRADYVLPSSTGWKIKNSGVFWPVESDESFRLIKDRKASSDHRLVWVDLVLNPSK